MFKQFIDKRKKSNVKDYTIFEHYSANVGSISYICTKVQKKATTEKKKSRCRATLRELKILEISHFCKPLCIYAKKLRFPLGIQMISKKNTKTWHNYLEICRCKKF